MVDPDDVYQDEDGKFWREDDEPPPMNYHPEDE